MCAFSCSLRDMSVKPLFSLLLPVFLLTACGEVEDTRPGTPVAHRQAAFRAILKSFEPMGIQLREERYVAETFRQHAEKLAQLKDAPWEYFGAETQYPPSKSTDRLWQEPEAFAAERDQFVRAVEDLQLAAQNAPEEAKQAVETLRAAYAPVEASCRSCHKRYRR
ncbi:MAG: cytochrome c [Zoogloeaceae bacterium]|jgi:cytochrome c556|nr:cytochrome c [Zoogloeaceae bacterium]